MAIDEKETLTGDAAFEKMRELLAHFPIAFMVTFTAGAETARPIGVVGDHATFDGSLWFITDRRSRKVAELAAGASTVLIFQNDARGAYLHMRGRASVVEDRERLIELYTPVQRTWFPDGPDDPNMTLLRFDADEADYWDGHQSNTRLVAAFVRSVVTGSPGKSGNAGIAKLG
jgi:general stress protein 26